MLSPSNNQSGERSKRAACDRCRGQKLKCVRSAPLPGNIGLSPCTRCNRLGSVCNTGPAQRLGRPAVLWNATNSHIAQQHNYGNAVEPLSPTSVNATLTAWEDSVTTAHTSGENTPLSPYGTLSSGLSPSMSGSDATTLDYHIADAYDRLKPGCTWESAVNNTHGPAFTFLHENAMDTVTDLNAHFEIPGSSLDAIMGTVLRMDIAPFPVTQAQHSAATNGELQRHESEDPSISAYDSNITKLLELGMRFTANVRAYRSSTGTNFEQRRSILQNSMGSSGELLAVLESIIQDGDEFVVGKDSNLSDAQALLSQASSCFRLEARQWDAILSEILLQLKRSPADAKTIAQVIPSTRMEGVAFNNTLLQARFFLQACMHTTQALCKQMDCLVELLSESGSTTINTQEVLKGARSVHAELLTVLERLHS